MKKAAFLLTASLAFLPAAFADMHEGPGMSSVVYKVLASPSKENPPNVGAREMADVTIEFNVHRNEMGDIDMVIVDYRVAATLGAEQTVRAMHIHRGGPTENGPVVVDGNFGPAAVVPAGSLSFFRHAVVDSMSGIETIKAIMENPGGYYFNLHTVQYPPGHFRGQLTPADALAAAVDGVDATAKTTEAKVDALSAQVEALDNLVRVFANSLGVTIPR